ncbi:MAG TPA: type II toxin-antitoxin system prevent-host-death family antitoxin [Thermomicrobiales bacterium]|nr:type II toxin-antitoxin system prevent-host-death family antitoxin [Thermomicrobiales bacterium]
MARTIPFTTSDTRLTDVIRELERTEGPIEIEENGKTVAVLLSVAEYQAYTRERAWQAIDDLRERNRDKTPDEIYQAVTEIVEEVRREMYEEKLAGSGGR